MSLPSTVPGSWSDHLSNRHGPFSTDGTNRYVFTVDQAAGKIRAQKSTDYGQTWTEQDSTHAPTTGSTTGYQTCDVIQVGTTFHVLCGADPGNKLSVHQFSADTWGSATSSTSAPVVVAIGATPGTKLSITYCSLAVRSNGDYAVTYQAATQNVIGTLRARFYTQIYSGSWGAATMWKTGIALGYQHITSVIGTSDRLHAWYWAENGVLFMNSLDTSNAFGTEKNLGALTAAYDHQGGVGAPLSWTNGGNIEVAYLRARTGAAVTADEFVSAANPTINTVTVAASGTSDSIAHAFGGTTEAGGEKFAVCAGGPNGATVQATRDHGTNTWTAPAIAENEDSLARQGAWFQDTGGIGQVGFWSTQVGGQAILWVQTTGVVKYDQLLGITLTTGASGWIYVGDPILYS